MDCDICFSRFDQEKPPKVLSRCGHTICSECISNIRQKSRNLNVQCPHCRLETSANDVRTNFALLGIIESLTTSSSEEVPRCSSHRTEPVSVFCVKCGIFICKDCFEVSSAPHSGHERMQIDKGVELICKERDRTSDRLREVFALNQEVIRMESLRINHANCVLANMVERATLHYTNVVAELKAELDAVIASLVTFQRTLSGDLDSATTSRMAIEEMMSSINTSNDITNLMEFTQKRALFERAIEHASFQNHIVDDLDKISLNSKSGYGNHEYLQIPLPKLTALSEGNRRLFSLEMPADRNDRDTSVDSERPARRIHRSTSNDRLSR